MLNILAGMLGMSAASTFFYCIGWLDDDKHPIKQLVATGPVSFVIFGATYIIGKIYKFLSVRNLRRNYKKYRVFRYTKDRSDSWFVDMYYVHNAVADDMYQAADNAGAYAVCIGDCSEAKSMPLSCYIIGKHGCKNKKYNDHETLELLFKPYTEIYLRMQHT